MTLIPDQPGVVDALKRDREAARALLGMLQSEGRHGHPAMDHLKTLEDEDRPTDSPWLVEMAAIAFEAGVRVHFGALLGPAIPQIERAGLGASGIEGMPDNLLRIRAPMPWEPKTHGDVPYIEVDWRVAVAAAGRWYAEGQFTVMPDVPGAALVAELAAQASDMNSARVELLGDVARDEVMDFVAARGSFLAQAIPEFVDLDREFRIYRECQIATG
ncbi:MAG: hypothetical protein AAFU80_17020 [Pseudomonadota bacterium]